ncbi:MAG TPA: hypothetical protein VE954_02505 [Oligoflexus sp.]|uniref:hypothetical protein n=1 Tax=Oligoflexus sp. TaxID=1971216 RepID=UPI002D360DB5|nr:hypothetical protein [Oligoflexus sp.]HYX31958.1 hypothetical protein [Oligoflexus sp.]
MKSSILFLGLGLSLATANAQEQNPIEVPAEIEKIFIPQGFDDNDNVEVVLHGKFPNTCYQVGNTEAKVDPQARTVTVSATSYKYPGAFCIQSVTPFLQTVKLGMIPEGNYQVVYSKNQQVRNSLEVSRRKTESPDDYLYATVENASIDVNFESGKQALKIQGHFPYFFLGCMVLKEVRVLKNPTDVLVVQPIAEVVTDEAVCATQPDDRSFEYTSGLAEPFQGEGLLHVRTLHGNSLNRYIEIK